MTHTNESLKRIMKNVGSLSEEVMRWKPSEEEWSIMEITAYLVAAIPNWLSELKEPSMYSKQSEEHGDNQLEWSKTIKREELLKKLEALQAEIAQSVNQQTDVLLNARIQKYDVQIEKNLSKILHDK